MSPFDLFALDDLESVVVPECLDPWLDGLLAAFRASPEGAALVAADSNEPCWFGRLFADYAIRIVGVPVTRMSPADAEEVVFDVFPRKVVMESAGEADEALREVVAFWQWLGREWKLEHAARIIERLAARGAELRGRMFDEQLWAPAKHFVIAGKQAGFDMHDPGERETFMHVYNAALGTGTPAGVPAAPRPTIARSPKKEKNKKKMAKLSRRRNRRK